MINIWKFANLIAQIDNYEESGSGWVLEKLINLDINFLNYNPLRASSYVKMPSTSKAPPKPTFNCSVCDSTFQQKYHLDRHIRTVHQKEPELSKGEFTCRKCEKQFTLKCNLQRHMKDTHKVDLTEEEKSTMK